MAANINRSNIAKELEPGLNAIYGMEYDRYEREHEGMFEVERSSRAFEEEVRFTGFAGAVNKAEGAAYTFATAREGEVSRYEHETIAYGFAITQEAIEDMLYDSLSKRLTKALARSMSHTKQVKAANVLNNAFSSSYLGGDGVALCSTAHVNPDNSTYANKPTTDVDLSEAALEDALIAISQFTDEVGIPIAVQARRLVVHSQNVFEADRLLGGDKMVRPGTSDRDHNAILNTGMLPGGYMVNHRLTDPDAWFLLTDAPDGLKHFERVAMATKTYVEDNTGNICYVARERYSFGWSEPRGVYASQGA